MSKNQTVRGMSAAVKKFNEGRKGLANNLCTFCDRGRVSGKICASCRGTGKKTI
jgi:hypothetical protein